MGLEPLLFNVPSRYSENKGVELAGGQEHGERAIMRKDRGRIEAREGHAPRAQIKLGVARKMYTWREA
jgi:hypothetical protein